MSKSDRSRSNERKKSKATPQKTYHWITLAEVRAREAKYLSRLAEIKIAKKFLSDAQLDVQVIVAKRLDLKRWEDYSNCVNLPEPHIPPQIRTFFEKIRVFEEEDQTRSINWLLATDECSILTQNIFAKDKTKKTLRNEILPDLGGRYDFDINLGLKVLKSLEYFFDDGSLTDQCPERILEDLLAVKKLAQYEIARLFDVLTYRVICCEDAYMTDIDPWTAEFIYASPNGSFEINIWTLKHIPIRFGHLENPYWDACLTGINVEVRLPLAFLEDDLTLRAIHLNFDHLSETAVSFSPVVDIPMENLNAGIPDLYECLVNEWMMQLKIQEEVRNSLIEKRLDFEDKKKEQEENEKEKAKERKNAKGDKEKGNPKKGKADKGDKNKVSKEPPNVEPGKYPDVWSDFLEREDKEYENFMNTVYHPDTLKLQPDEINLKQYFILGGIYQLFFVEKPRHCCIRTFNMTWHENEGRLHVRKNVKPKDVKIDSDSDEDRTFDPITGTFTAATPAQVEARRSLRKSLRKSATEDADPNVRYAHCFRVTFVLPEYLCLWSAPIVCHYEDDAIGYVEEELKQVQSSTAHPSKSSAKVAAAKALAEQKATEKKTRDPAIFESSVITTSVGRHSTVSSLNIYRPAISFQSFSRHSLTRRSVSQFYDFCLDLPIAQPDLRNLERHCVPRILSSYRFRKELEEKKNDKGKDKSKGLGGMLMRKQSSSSNDEPESFEPEFPQDLEEVPERLFPRFKKPEPLVIPNENRGEMSRPETFAELIETLDDIKKQYMERPTDLLHLPDNLGVRKMPKSLKINETNRFASRSISRHQRQRFTEREMSIRKKDKDKDKASLKSFSLSHRRSASSYKRRTYDYDYLEGSEVDDDHRASRRPTKRGRKQFFDFDGEEEEDEFVDNRGKYFYTHWTTKYIEYTNFDRASRKLTIFTSRLGILGLAYNRYQHFPFRKWTLEPTDDNEIRFTVETPHITAVLTITTNGVKGYVTDTTDSFVANPKKYLDIQEPIDDYKELKKLFREKNVNIFADLDASFYIKGYFSQKHLAAEMHVYSCMAVHCSSIKFMRSDWNRLAKRREILLSFRGVKDLEENVVTVRVRPEDATFVEVKELCSDNLNVIKLDFKKTWRNINEYHDLHNLIVSMFPGATDARIRDPMLLTTIKNILSEVRPLSYS